MIKGISKQLKVREETIAFFWANWKQTIKNINHWGEQGREYRFLLPNELRSLACNQDLGPLFAIDETLLVVERQIEIQFLYAMKNCYLSSVNKTNAIRKVLFQEFVRVSYNTN